MADLDQFYFLRRNDNFLLFELKDLSAKRHIGRLQKKSEHSTYLDYVFALNLNFKRFDEESGENTPEGSEELSDEISSTVEPQIERNADEYPEINENLLCGVPELIKHTDQASGLPVYFHFIIGKETVLIAVSLDFYTDIKRELINFLREFEKIFDAEQILSVKSVSKDILKKSCMVLLDIKK